MGINAREINGVTVLELFGEIDINTSPDLRKSFDQVLKEKKQKIVLNFAQVGYIDSSGLATLVEMLQRLKRLGGTLRLANLSQKVKNLFEITKLDKLFSIFADLEEALKDF